MGLPYDAEELEGSPQIDIDEEGMVATRTFRLPRWNDWRLFSRDLLGHYQFLGTIFYFVRPIEFPGFPNLIATRVRIAPFDPANPRGAPFSLRLGTTEYPNAGAKVIAEYRTLYDGDNRQHPNSPSVPDGTYLTYRSNLAVEVDHTPARAWVYSQDGAPVPEDLTPSLLRPQGSFQLTWHRVIRPPWGAMRELLGKVNSSPFLGASPQTVLFLGATTTRQFHLFDEGGFWQVRYAFSEQARRLTDGETVVGFNHFFRPDAGANEEVWQPVHMADSSPPRRPYQSADFTRLFQFE